MTNLMRILTTVGIFICVGMVVLSVVTIFNPLWTLDFVVSITATVILIFGFFRIFRYLVLPPQNRNNSMLLTGALNLIGALLLIILPEETTLRFFSTALGLMVIWWGATKIFSGIKLKRLGGFSWKFILTIGIISVLIGCALMFLPRFTYILLVYTLAAYLGIAGVYGLVELWRARKNQV